MTKEEIEAQALRLNPKDRASLARRLLESLESLTDVENERVWAEEAAQRDAQIDADPSQARPADEVLKDARARLK